MTRAEAAQTLGVGANATSEEIRAAYRRAALQHHPDRGGTAADFHRVKTAAAILLEQQPADPDPQSRKSREQWMRDLDRLARLVVESPDAEDVLSILLGNDRAKNVKVGVAAYLLVSSGITDLLKK